jgi:PhzF family phenazine biosynthesis protein
MPMPQPRRLYQIDAFTNRPFSGNPAGVVANADGLTERQMQAIARELSNSETAFLLPPLGPDHDVHVRFFTPTTEVPICGHATISVHYVRALEGAPAGVTRQLTGAGVLPVEIEKSPEVGLRIWMTQKPATFERILTVDQRGRLLRALNVSADALATFGEVQVVSTGHSKVMVPLRSRATLEALKPDLATLSTLSIELGCNGYYPFTLDAPSVGTFSSGRMFAPAIGIVEDPVTGNAAGPLGAYLLRAGVVEPRADERVTFVVGQGEAIGRPGSVLVEVARSSPSAAIDVRIAGQAVVVFKSELEVEP